MTNTDALTIILSILVPIFGAFAFFAKFVFSQFDKIDKRFDKIEDQLNDIRKEILEIRKDINKLEMRLATLEVRVEERTLRVIHTDKNGTEIK